MANYGGYGYQYETSPKKLQPEYVPTKKAKKKTGITRLLQSRLA